MIIKIKTPKGRIKKKKNKKKLKIKEKHECYCCHTMRIIEKHHPDGMIDEWRYVIDEEGNRLYKPPIRVHVNPNNFVYVCRNCHGIIHKEKISHIELKEKTIIHRSNLKKLIKNVEKTLLKKRERFGLKQEEEEVLVNISLLVPSLRDVNECPLCHSFIQFSKIE